MNQMTIVESRKWGLLLGWMALILLCGVARAADYLLGPEDVLTVTVLRHPELSAEQVVVASNGKINLPMAGTITVSGKTVEQVRREITKRLEMELNHPDVTVTLKQQRPRQVFVQGVVQKPGVSDIKPGWHVTDALAVAGGLTTRPDLVEGTLTRRNVSKPIILDVPALISNSNSPKNLLLQPGDTLRFTERTIPVNVTGIVKNPGSYSIKTGSGADAAVAAAGGADSGAALTKATVTRANGKVLPVNLFKIMVLGQREGNVTLEPGDLLTVPAANAKVTVMGAVAQPGQYDITDGIPLHVSDAVARAGGYTLGKAALSQTTVRRANGTVVPVDLHKIMVLGQREGNIALEPGDMLMVPESKDRVTVLGAVQKPGAYDIEDGKVLRIGEALAQAGGPTATAVLAKASVMRGDGTIIPVDLYKVQVQGDPQGNIALQAGDLVMVPESKARVTILGAVQKPGPYNIEEGQVLRVSDALALAGGLSVKPEMARISISRLAPETAPAGSQPRIWSVDPVKLLAGDDAQNGPVQDGDLINVSEVKSPTVLVSGEVKNPGAFELKEGDSLPELITRAGGPTLEAALTRVIVERNGVKHIKDVLASLKNGVGMDFPLQEGDFVVVQKNTARVLVIPAVNNPGYYPIPENGALTVGEALILAGGPKDRAKTKEIGVLRQTKAGVQPQLIKLDEMQGKTKGKDGYLLALNVPLRDGDVLYVPEGGEPKRSWWEKMMSFVPFVGGFFP